MFGVFCRRFGELWMTTSSGVCGCFLRGWGWGALKGSEYIYIFGCWYGMGSSLLCDTKVVEEHCVCGILSVIWQSSQRPMMGWESLG